MAPRKCYTKKQMAKAIEEVRNGEKISIAATRYEVPRITLYNKITGKTPIDCNPGPTTILTSQEERLLVRWIFFMAEKHFPVTKDHLLDSVQKIIAEKNLQACPFSNNRPGKKWYASFLKRHPDLSEHVAQSLSKAREPVTEKDILSWCQVIKSYFQDKDLLGAISDPQRIFSADESAFFLKPKAGRVKVRKTREEKNVHISLDDENENLTMLVTGNAAGVLAPPMIVYPYEHLSAVITNSVPKDWCIGRSETGGMCAKTFFEYVTNVFNPWIGKNHIPKPVILFLDGHRSHMTLQLSDFCKENGIELIALYPNSTHLLQPINFAVFGPLKVSWKNQVKSWKIENPKQKIKKDNFAPILEAALQNITADTIRYGFRKSGIFPFGMKYMDMNKLSSLNCGNVSTSSLDLKIDTAIQFLNILNSEIRTSFTNEKLNLFTRLYYKADVDERLPYEDLSLYTIWAKTKHFLDESLPQASAATIVNRQLQVSQSSEPEIPRQSPNSSQTYAATILEHSLPRQVSQSPKPNPLREGLKILPKMEVEDNSLIYELQENILNGSQASGMTQEKLGAENFLPNHIRPTTSFIRQTSSPICTENKGIDGAISDLEYSMQSSITDSKDIAFSEVYTASNKAMISANLPIKSQNLIEENIPSLFKRAIIWPEPESKKRRTNECTPSAITGDFWCSYEIKTENDEESQMTK